MIDFSNIDVVERSAQVKRAVGSVRLEGVEPTVDAKRIFERYANGEITVDEMGAEVRALNARQFGPVPVSGD